MYREYLKFVFRKLSRNRLYTGINVIGLTIALTAALLIYSHIVKELKTDRFHPRKENIYRITTTGIFNDHWTNHTCGPMGPFAAKEIAAVENYTHLCCRQYLVQTNDSIGFIKPGRTVVADASLFRIFDFPLISGEVPQPNNLKWCILSAKTALKLFGERNPVGIALQTKTNPSANARIEEYQIAGVMADIPAHSSIQADIIFNYGAVEDMAWNNWGIETYLLLSPNADVPFVEENISQLYVQNYPYGSKQNLQVQLQPLTDIYFHSDHIICSVGIDNLPPGSFRLTIILCIITLIILLLATCNYMMIKIARMSKEFPTMAIQKCYGACNRNLQYSILLETGIQVFIALIFASMAAYALHPWFINILSPRQPYSLNLTIQDIFIFTSVIILLIAGTGGYLCYHIARHLNRNNLKESIIRPVRRFDLKNVLATAQMSIFCTLLFCSAIVTKQMDYIKNKDLGLNTRDLLATFIGFPDNYEVFKEEAIKSPSILTVSIGTELPVGSPMSSSCIFPEHPETELRTNVIQGDADYLGTYQIEITQGENIHKEVYLSQQKLSDEYAQRFVDAKAKGLSFTEEKPTYEIEALVNENFVKKAGLANPIGTIFTTNSRNFRIVGVTRDFHYQPLYNPIAPLLISYNGGFNDQSANIRYRTGELYQAIRHIDNVSKAYPYRSEEITYREYKYSNFYDKDIAFIKMIHILTGLAILIGGMGIFALSVFLAESKKREVALRKVNGASEYEVISLLNRTFIRRVIPACFIGIPVAYLAMQKWLESYAYRAPASWSLFIVVTIVCIGFVITVVSWQTWMAATRNPVESLKRQE